MTNIKLLEYSVAWKVKKVTFLSFVRGWVDYSKIALMERIQNFLKYVIEK